MHSRIKGHHYKYAAQLGLCVLSIGSAMSAEPLFDPTQPYGERAAPRVHSAAAPAALQLEAILHSSERRLAIVNGQLVHEGDRIANSVIETITPTSVRYSTQGQPHTLSLAVTILPDKQLSIRPAALTQSIEDKQP